MLPRGRRVSEAGGPRQGRGADLEAAAVGGGRGMRGAGRTRGGDVQGEVAGGGCLGILSPSLPAGAAPALPRSTALAGTPQQSILPLRPRALASLGKGAGKAAAEWDAALKGAFEGKIIMQKGGERSSLSRLFSALFSIGKLSNLDSSCQKTILTLDFYLVP